MYNILEVATMVLTDKLMTIICNFIIIINISYIM